MRNHFFGCRLVLSALLLAGAAEATVPALPRPGACDTPLLTIVVPDRYAVFPLASPVAGTVRIEATVARAFVEGEAPEARELPTPTVFWALEVIGPMPSGAVVHRSEGLVRLPSFGAEARVSARLVSEWDGRLADGSPAPAGVYHLRARARVPQRPLAEDEIPASTFDNLTGGRAVLDACEFPSFVVVDHAASAPAAPTAIPPGYYDSVNTSSAANLRSTLHAVVDDHQWFGYASGSPSTRDILAAADEHPTSPSDIIDIYKNQSYGKTSTAWNREHTWPKTYGFPDDGFDADATAGKNYPYVDCHHLRASDIAYNSDRSSRVFDDCAASCTRDATVFNAGRGGANGTYPDDDNWYDGNVVGGRWQTWNGRKGDVARSIFYMAIRYEGGTHTVTGDTEPDLEPSDSNAQIQSAQGGANKLFAWMGMLTDMKAWHAADPVDADEQRRNDVVYGFQGNRNPFVDHPEWVDCIWGGNCGCAVSAAPTATPNPSACSPASFQLAANPTPSVGNYSYLWTGPGLSSTTVANPTVSGLTSSANYTVVVTDLNPGGCSTPAMPVTAVVRIPTATPTATPSSICLGSSSQLAANPSGGVGPYTYLWTGPGLSATNVPNPVATPVSGGVAAYTVTVTDVGSGCVGAPVNVNVSVSAGTPPSPPTGITAAAGATDVLVTWDNTLASGNYRIYRAAGNCASGVFNLVQTLPRVAGATNSWLNSGLAAGTTYCYRVAADDGLCAGSLSTCSLDACAVPGALPEVSGGAAAQKLQLAMVASGLQVRFQHVGPNYRYHLYGAASKAQIDAQAWDWKACDLATNVAGTWTTDGSTWNQWIVTDPSQVPSADFVVIAEKDYVEGSYGLDSTGGSRPKDADQRGTTTLNCTPTVVPTSSAQIVINELHPDPDDLLGDANGDGEPHFREDEFVEFVNVSSDILDLSGMEIHDTLVSTGGTPGLRHVFPNGTFVFPCKAVVVFGGGVPTGSFGGAIVQLASTGELNLSNNTGDTIVLKSAGGGATVGSVTYDGTQGNQNQSLNRNPDGSTSAFVNHTTMNAALRYSPGTKTDGSVDCWAVGVPSCSIASPSGGFSSGNVTVTFSAVDSNSASLTMSFAYSTDGVNFLPATAAGSSPLSNPAVNASPWVGEQFVWASANDIPGTASVTFRVTVEDGTTSSVCTTSFTVANGSACGTELFFSEYVEGTGNNKALEIYNGTGVDVDLSAGGYVLEAYHNGGTIPLYEIPLVGVVAAGDVFVIADPNASATILSQADQTDLRVDFNGNDPLVLRKGGAVVDSIGQVGNDPGAGGWGTDPANTTDNTLRRKLTVSGGDLNPLDAFAPAAEWDGYVVDTVAGLGSHSLTCAGGGDCAEVYVSEYVEGSGFNKGLEIYNPTASSLNLATGSYSVEIYTNGSGTASITIPLTGSVAANGVYLLAHASASFAGSAQQTAANLDFNGNDAVVVKKGTVVIDVIGRIGEDPGPGWGTDPANTEDNTLRRKSTVKKGDVDGSNAFDPATEWDGYVVDTFGGLGSHTSSCGGGGGSCPTELFISEYVEGSSNNKAIEIVNRTGAAVNLATAPYNIQIYSNGSGTPSATINLTGNLANADVHVLVNNLAGAPLSVLADQTSGSLTFNGDDAVVLRKGAVVIDVIGQIGFDPGTEWGTGVASTADNTIRRKAAIIAGDSNGADAFDPSIQWDGFANDTFDGLGSHTITGCP